MASHAGYPRGSDFPNEGFVQQSVETHFRVAGFEIRKEGHADLVAVSSAANECWQVECKGQTSNVGLDFHTGLGQLVQRMQIEVRRYGLAIPETREFRRQCSSMSEWVCKRLGLVWLVVRKDGSVVRLEPGQRWPEVEPGDV